MQAEIDEKNYKENKKRDALQRVQYEIDQQNQKKKIMKEHKERMRLKREQIENQKQQEEENKAAASFQVKMEFKEGEQIEQPRINFYQQQEEVDDFEQQEALCQQQVPVQEPIYIQQQESNFYPEAQMQQPPMFAPDFHEPEQKKAPVSIFPKDEDGPKNTISMVN